MTQENNHMNFDEYVITALELVSTWNVPDENFADTVNDQAMLMAGVSPDDFPERLPETH